MANGKINVSTYEGIAEAEADLERFIVQIENCVTARMLPWGLVVGRRQMEIDAAKARLAALEAAKQGA